MSIFDALKKLVYPQICLGCKKASAKRGGLCGDCFRIYERDKSIVCRKCGGRNCRCRCRPTYASENVFVYLSVFPYRENSPGGQMILCLKRRKNKSVLELLGSDMAKSLENGCILRSDAVVCFVPRSRQALLESGVDQARELGKVVAEKCSLPLVDALGRKQNKGAQKDLDAAARAEYAKKCYKISGKCPDLTGKQVILVDDILTTGATLSACAALLKSKGADQIVCLTAGRRRRQ